MKTPEEVHDKFDALVRQRDSLTNGSAARGMVNQRVLSLAWVIDHPEVAELLLSQSAADLYDCLE